MEDPKRRMEKACLDDLVAPQPLRPPFQVAHVHGRHQVGAKLLSRTKGAEFGVVRAD